jgi:uncharacterized protein (DUF433 family)
MTPALTTEPIPLETDAEGTVRVRGTRVTLDTVVESFLAGAIADWFPTVALADAYAVILYYLRHRPEVDAYLAERGRAADAIRERSEATYDKARLRERLLAQGSSPDEWRDRVVHLPL